MIDESKFVTHYNLPHKTFSKVPTFKWYDAPAWGVGKRGKPIISLDYFPQLYCLKGILHSVQHEIDNYKENLLPHLKSLVVNGIVPRVHNRFVPSIDSFLVKYNHDNCQKDIENLEYLSEIKKYFYGLYGLEEFWRGVIHVRDCTTFAKKAEQSKWKPYMDKFTALRALVEALPFKQLGCAMFFVSKPGVPVYIHRDTYVRNNHVSNFINIMFDDRPKPTFVYDSSEKRRHYLPTDSSFYTFNECDLHGVDPEPEERWMLRVEGLFLDEFAEALGMTNNEVLNWSYDKPKAFLKRHPKGPKIYESTFV